MNYTEITFNEMPGAMIYLISKVEALERLFQTKNEPTTPADHWLNIDELKEFLPDKPAKATIYGWVSTRQIPYHKRGKKLYFKQSEIDNWLADGKRRSETDLLNEASKYLDLKKGGKRYE